MDQAWYEQVARQQEWEEDQYRQKIQPKRVKQEHKYTEKVSRGLNRDNGYGFAPTSKPNSN